MFEYFAVLRVAASSAADPASRAAAATYESANGQITVTSQVSGFPASQGTRERPSGRFPSDRLRPSGSFVHGMPAETMARATKSFRAWCLAGLPGAFLETKPYCYCTVQLFQSTMYGMGFAFALIVAKKRRLLGDNCAVAASAAVQSGSLCRVLIWLAGILSTAGLVVSLRHRRLLFNRLLLSSHRGWSTALCNSPVGRPVSGTVYHHHLLLLKGKGSPYSIAERSVPDLVYWQSVCR